MEISTRLNLNQKCRGRSIQWHY